MEQDEQAALAVQGERRLTPQKRRLFRLNQTAWSDLLNEIPLEFTEAARNQPVVVEMPMPDGSLQQFRIEESPILAPHVAAEIPGVKTFSGQGVDDPTTVARFDWTSLRGFHGYVLTSNGTVFIDPYQENDRENYLVYYKHDYGVKKEFHCDVKQPELSARNTAGPSLEPAFSVGSDLRTYRLAIAATGEYTTFHGGQAAALTAVMTAVNRLVGIYRRDAAISFTLVSGTNTLFPDAMADPYDNSSSGAQLNINQTQLDTIIGAANYDVGHLFVTSGGGLAATPAACNNAAKAQAASGLNMPTGDPFVVDIVAHEIGHQFSADHSYNNSGDGGCTTRSAAHAFEPGSGASIMSYSGTCDPRNLQGQSMEFFTVQSLDQIITFRNDMAGGAGCGTLTMPGNTPPTINALANFTIPRNTPFALRATANDVNDPANQLTYSWEENDLGPATSSAGAADSDADGMARPIFRVMTPTNEGATRNFPSLTYILNNANVPPATYTGTSPTGAVCDFGNCITGEVLPSIARVMSFRVTVRDSNATVGGTADATMTVTVDGGSGPFSVTAPNTGVSFGGGSAQTVTWNVSNTQNAPVSAANVKISLSTDGGNTFPTVLLASTPNDGSQSVTIPNTATTTARIKVEAVGNIFFDISDANFTITASSGFIVNTADDHNDGTCNVADCALREAINAANAAAGSDTINFAVGAGGAQTINLTTALPAITDPVTIDGATQTGFAGTPLIELNGTGAGASNGLNFQAGSGGSTVKSLVINRFNLRGINADGAGISVQGCFIGTNAAGTAASANGTGGIRLNGVGNTIGGTTAAERNVISGNNGDGILIASGAPGSLIQGNYIGVNATGNAGLGNTPANGGGINIVSSNNNIIGGTAAGAGNLLSGNTGANVYGMQINNSTGTTVRGNIVGLNAAGTATVQNGSGGIIILGGSANIIGGAAVGARNVISGNGGAGILILSDMTQVQGNYFGTNAAGTAALGNGASGILINGGDNNTIGGTSAAARNVVSGNGNGGIRIFGSANNNTVQGNYIGTDAGGTIGLGNGVNFAGVLMQNNCVDNTIGGTGAGAGNLIAFNQGPGVNVPDGSRNAILGNSIFSNTGLGIDLDSSGVTANDSCDADSGGNNQQNFPVITSVTPGATDTTIAGTLNSTASTQFRIEFFANTSCDPAGNGEGKVFIGSTNVMTDGACNANFNFIVSNASITGPMITATATDPNNNTSEFSACKGAPLANTIQFATSTYSVSESGPGITVTVNRSGDTSAAATVAYATGDTAGANNCNVFGGAASSRCDYLITLGRLRFAASETSKMVTIPIINDSYAEGAETFTIALSNPTGSTVGDPDTATITISDNESSTGPNPITQTGFFVREHYLDFLNREPDTAGFNFWSNDIDNCTPKPQCTEVHRINVSASFFLSIEFQQTGYLVERFYKVAYGDAAGNSMLGGAHQLSVPVVRLLEFLADTQRIGEGVVVLQPGWETVLENNKQAYAGEFVQTTRFITEFPTSMTPTQFVDKLNQNAGNVLSSGERTTAINLFAGAGDTNNTTARAQAVRQVAEDADLVSAEFNRAFVLMQYFGYLRRNPNDPQDADHTGYDFWLQKLNQFNGNYIQAEMVKAFLSSIEYRQRFGP